MTTLASADLQQAARDHLWMHFTRMSGYASNDVPITSMSGVSAESVRWASPGNSLRRERSPVAPNSTITCGEIVSLPSNRGRAPGAG